MYAFNSQGHQDIIPLQ